MFGWNTREKVKFESVPSEDSETLLLASERSSVDAHRVAAAHNGISWLAAGMLVTTTAILSALLGAWVTQRSRLDADAFSIRYTSQYSPIIEEVPIRYSLVRFNGSLMKSNVFRQDFGDEVDAAWRSLGVDYVAARVPEEHAAASGIAPDQVKIKKEYGGGYPANVEGLHHLHCLKNLLRKSLPWNVDYYQKQGLGPFSNDAQVLKYHTTHCLDILRQQLMCTADVGILGQVWYQPPGKELQAFVDFNTMHKCKNFGDIRSWAEKHQLPKKKDAPEDFLELPKPGDRVWHTVP